MNEADDKKRARDQAKWPIYVGPILGVISADVVRNFVPHMDSASREIIVAVAAAILSSLLIFGIYKVVRDW